MNEGIEICYTDGWHPTVNPSARMPVHHFRFVSITGKRSGILNEFPRRRGGSTLRLMRFSRDGVNVIDLPGTLEWVPWWLPASDEGGAQMIAGVYETALLDDRITARERRSYERALAEFQAQRTAPDVATLGEAQARAMDRICREFVPTLPELELISLTRSPLRHVLAGALAAIPAGAISVLAQWARVEGVPLWPLVAVATINDLPYRVRLHAESAHLDAEPLLRAGTGDRGRRIQAVPEDEVLRLLDEGRLLPGARLVAVAEAALHGSGVAIRHFGNTYGHSTAAGALLGIDGTERLPYCDDDKDSWPFAHVAVGEEMPAYPLHLLDVAYLEEDARAAVNTLVAESLATGAPVLLHPRSSLDETVLSRGS